MTAYRRVKFFNLTPIFLALIFILSYGCKKCDLPRKDERSCRIVSVNGEQGDRRVFHYTSWGDPEFIDVEDQGTGRPDYYFKYDNHRRLIELQARYAENDFEVLTRYYYEAGKVVRDSSFYFPNPDNLYVYEFAEGQYLYDNYDRIIAYSNVRYSTDINGGGYQEDSRGTATYTYPSEDPFTGNRNYLAGNRVLMFVNKYYHKTTAAESYNDLGYPTKFVADQPQSMLGFDVFDIQYDCTTSEKSK